MKSTIAGLSTSHREIEIVLFSYFSAVFFFFIKKVSLDSEFSSLLSSSRLPQVALSNGEKKKKGKQQIALYTFRIQYIGKYPKRQTHTYIHTSGTLKQVHTNTQDTAVRANKLVFCCRTKRNFSLLFRNDFFSFPFSYFFFFSYFEVSGTNICQHSDSPPPPIIHNTETVRKIVRIVTTTTTVTITRQQQ